MNATYVIRQAIANQKEAVAVAEERLRWLEAIQKIYSHAIDYRRDHTQRMTEIIGTVEELMGT
jgi:uncharacterized protein YqgV (UPF0045/DUF77 family)